MVCVRWWDEKVVDFLEEYLSLFIPSFLGPLSGSSCILNLNKMVGVLLDHEVEASHSWQHLSYPPLFHFYPLLFDNPSFIEMLPPP